MHWDTYQQRLTTTHKYQLSDLYDILLTDSGRSKSTADGIGRFRGTEEANISQDIVNMLTDDPNLSENALGKSESLLDKMLYDRRIGLSTLAVVSTLAIKTLRDCCGGVEDPRATLRVVSSLDITHKRLGLSFAELDQIRLMLEDPLLHHQIGVKLTGGGGGGDIVIWGIPEGIAGIDVQEFDCDHPQPTLIWQLSRDGLGQDGALCNHPPDFHHYEKRVGAPPLARTPEKHQATVLQAHGASYYMPIQPKFLFDVYRELRKIALKGTCLYLYCYDNEARDKFEPLYLTWPAQNDAGGITLKSLSFHSKEGFVLLKDLLVAFAQQGKLALDNPYPLLEPDGHLKPTVSENIDAARGALSRYSHKSHQETGLAFPLLRAQWLQKTKDVIRISLKLPANSCLFVIRPFHFE